MARRNSPPRPRARGSYRSIASPSSPSASGSTKNNATSSAALFEISENVLGGSPPVRILSVELHAPLKLLGRLG